LGEGEGQVPSVFLTVDNMKPMEWKQLEFLEDVIQYVSESSNLCQWIKTIMKNIFVLGIDIQFLEQGLSWPTLNRGKPLRSNGVEPRLSY
jgi:hypothetical protein